MARITFEKLHLRVVATCVNVGGDMDDREGDDMDEQLHLRVVATSTGRPRYSETRSTMSLSVRALNTEKIKNQTNLDKYHRVVSRF